MSTNFELEAWVNDFEVSDDEKKALLTALNKPQIVAKLKDSVLRQSDYSRKLDEMRTEKESLSAKQQEVLDMEKQLVEWRDENNPKFSQALEESERLKKELKTLTDAYIGKGGSVSELSTGTTPPAKVDEKPAFDTSSFVSKDDLSKVVPALTQWPVQFQRIAQEHFKLTGEYPDGEKILAEVYKGKSAQQAWEDTHGIPAIREQKQKEHFEAELKAAREDERAKVMTEMAVDPAARRDNATGSFSTALALANEDPSAAVVADQNSRAKAAKLLEGFDPRL
jgi:hypothetical protein